MHELNQVEDEVKLVWNVKEMDRELENEDRSAHSHKLCAVLWPSVGWNNFGQLATVAIKPTCQFA